MTPGFHAFLRRQYPEEFVNADSQSSQRDHKQENLQRSDAMMLTAKDVGFEEGSKAGDFTAVEIKGSSSIRQLRYNNKTKVLLTTYTSGAIYPFKDIEPEDFLAVIHPSEKYGYSVGRAHHAIIVQRKKEKKNAEENMESNIR
jgi:KTSC domain